MKTRAEQSEKKGFTNGPKLMGSIWAAGHVIKKVVQDTKTRHSLRKIRENNAVFFKTGGGIAKEVIRNPQVRETAKNLGRNALVSSGIVDYDPEAEKMTPNWKGIGRAILLPEVAIGNAIDSVRSDLPELINEAAHAAPDAIRNYGEEHPGAFKEVGRAALSNMREAVMLPLHMGRAALVGMFEAYQPV